MNRAYYKNSITDFLKKDSSLILGELSLNHTNRSLEDLQRNAWVKQIEILKKELIGLIGSLYFEFQIPRMGKRVDNIIIVNDYVFVLEFKVGDNSFGKNAELQVIDYCLDLKNFHEGSHFAKLVPFLVATNAYNSEFNLDEVLNHNQVVKCNQIGIRNAINLIAKSSNEVIDVSEWENSIYKPTPTIVEVAQALYKGHKVEEISRHDSGNINLNKTSNYISNVIEESKQNSKKSICFITGVPGAGKTLAGLSIANDRMRSQEDEHAVFLSGNGPLVEVLREALARDYVITSKEKGERVTKDEAKRRTNAFIQNIHHFRDEYLKYIIEPTEKVVVFDEAQRAWSKEQVRSFMKRKKGIENFEMSEPEFLIDVMNRHKDWCTIVCLIGGGQEINTGEAGLEEWIRAFEKNYKNWDIHFSNSIINSSNYIKEEKQRIWLRENGVSETDLHLAVSVRSYRSEKVSEFVHELLELNKARAKVLYSEIKKPFPIYLTRNVEVAKKWLRQQCKGTERYGLVASSGSRRLKAIGVNVKNEISAPNWFLNPSEDIRSSYFLEDVATEFDIQGLEIDRTCLIWGANFYLQNDNWIYQNFKGSKWQNINKEVDKEYLKNSYRVLLTRARQGMIICVPNGSDIDHTRPKNFYDKTYDYLKEVGIEELK